VLLAGALTASVLWLTPSPDRPSRDEVHAARWLPAEIVDEAPGRARLIGVSDVCADGASASDLGSSVQFGEPMAGLDELILVSSDEPTPPEAAPAVEPPSLPEPIAPLEKKIVFSFSKTPWDVALTRFAELAELQLILNFKPPGTFDYTSSKAYTIPEALDVLNEVLIAEGFAILRNDRFLTLAALDKPLPINQVPTVDESELGKHGRNEFVTIARRLKFADPSALEPELKKLLGPYGQVQSVPQLKLIRLTDLASRLQEALPLVAELDESAKPPAAAAPPAAPPVVRRTIALTHLTPTRAQSLIQSILGIAGKIEPGPDDKSLIAVLTEAQHAEVAAFLKEIDVETSVSDQPAEKTFTLRDAQAASVAALLESLFPEDDAKVRLAAEPSANVVSASGPAKTLEQVARIVQALDEQAKRNAPVQATYSVAGDAKAVAEQLRSAFITREVKNITITPGPDEMTLLVLAPPAIQEQIREAIKRLGGGGDETSESTEVIKLEHATAEKLSATLTSVFSKATTGATFGSEATSNSIIVRAPARTMASIVKVVKDLDLPATLMGLRDKTEEIYEAKHAEPADLVKLIESLYPTSTNVVLVPTGGGRKLVVSAPPALLEKVKGTLDLFDQAAGATPPPTDRTYTLRHAPPDEIIAALKGLLQSDQTSVRFVPDDRNRRLFVVAVDEKMHERIAGMINDLDVPSPESEVVEVYTIKNAAPAAILDAVEKVFADETKATFTLRQDGKSLLIRSPRRLKGRIADLLEKVDVAPTDPGTEPTDELYRLKFAKAADLVTALVKLYPPDRTNVKISAEPGNNVLIVTAPADVQERIKSLIEKVDVPTDTRMQLQIYVPESLSPSSVATLASQLRFEGVGTFASSADGRLLLAVATKEGHEKIQGLLDLLATRADDSEPVRRVYPMQNAPAASVASVVQTLFPVSTSNATIVSDPTGSKVIVQAPPKLQTAIAELIGQVDIPSQLEEYILTAKHVPVGSLYTQIYSLFGGVDGTRVTYDIASNSVSIASSAAIRKQINEIVEKFDQPIDPATGRQRQIYKVRYISAAAAYSGLVTLFPSAETGVVLNYENSNQIVIATASAALQERIAQELERLDVNPRGDWVTKTLRPVHAGASELSTFLTTQMAGIAEKSITLGAHGQEVVVSGRPEAIAEADRLFTVYDVKPVDGDGRVRRIYRARFANASYMAINLQTEFPKVRRVDVSADPYSSTVTVVAPPELQEEIAQVVAELDENPRKEWVEAVIEPKNSTPDQLVQLLTTAMASETSKTITASPNGRVVVLGPSGVVDRARRLAETLDAAPAEGGESTPKVYPVKFAMPYAIYQFLQTMYPSGTSTVKITYDPTASTVTVLGSAAVHDKISAVIASMDVDPKARYQERIFSPKHVSATQLVTLLQTALASDRQTTVALGPQKSTVVVFAPEETMPRIERYLTTLDTAEAVAPSRQLYKLQFGNASYLVSTIQALYPAAQYPVVVTSDPANNILVVEAPPTIQDTVGALLRELDVEQGGRTQVVYRLEHTRASNILTAVRTLLSSGSAAVVAGPDDRSLVVNGVPEQQEKVKSFLADFDKAENSQDPKSKVYHLRFATASNIDRMIDQLFAGEANVRVTFDDAMNTVFVTAPPETLKQIEAIINDADQEGADSQFQSEVFRLKEASANDVARALTAAFSDRKKAVFVADSDAGTVFVRGLPRVIEEVRTMVGQLDQPREEKFREVGVFDLFEVDPFQASSIVQELFQDARSDDRPRVESTFDPARLIVRANPTQMKEIREVLARLEGSKVAEAGEEGAAEGPKLSDRAVERVIRLNNADPEATMKSIVDSWRLLRRNKLNLIFRLNPLGIEDERLKEAPIPEEAAEKPEAAANLPGDPDVPVTVIVGNDRLTVSSRDTEALDLMQSLAEAWTEPFDPDRSASRVFYIENADVTQMAAAIDEAFNGKSRQEGDRRRFRPERVRIVAEPQANALIVRASPVDLVNVKELIDSLDLSPASDKKPRIIALKQADAAEVLVVVKEVFEDYLTPGSGPPISVPGARGTTARLRTTAMSVDIDPRSNSLIVSAPETVLGDVEELIKGLESAAADTQKSYRVIPIDNASPGDVRQALEVLLDRQLSRTGGSSGSSSSTGSSRRTRTPRPKRTAPSRSSSSSVMPASPRESTSSTQVTTIRQGNDGVEIAGVKPLRVPADGVRQVAANEDDLSEEDLVTASAEEPAEEGDGGDDVVPAETALGPLSGNVDISLLDDVGALLLLGTEKDLQILSDVVAQIERINKIKELSFELLPLEHTKAGPLAELLIDLTNRLLDARGSGSRAARETTVIPLAKPNALLLVAAKDEIGRLVELAKRFDVTQKMDGQFRVFRLKHVRATTLARTVESFYANRDVDGNLAPEVVVESDDRSNTIVVYAGPNDMGEVAKLVEELDTSKTARINELRIFYLKHTVSTELAGTLQATLQTGQGATATATTTAGTTSRGQPGLEIVDPDEPSRRIGSGILEGVTITPNRRANAIIVSAPKEVMKLIETLVERLDVLPEAVAEIKVFTLVNSDAVTMVQTLRALFAQLQSDSNRIAVTAGPDTESSPLIELTFSVDERTNSILASGSREQLEVVEAIILRLDGSDIEERRTDVYRLKNAPAQDVALALTELLAQQQQIQGIQEGQSLQQQLEQEVIVVPEMISNSLLISASPRFYDRVLGIIEKLDALPPQVVIQVLLAQVQLDGDSEFGVELGLQDPVLFDRSNQNSTLTNQTGPFFRDGSQPGFNFNTGGPLGNNIFAPNPGTVGTQGLSNFALGRTNSALGFGGLVLSASSDSVSVLIRALARCRRLEVLSRPQIMTLDNQQATIVVGAEVPRITGSNLVQGAGVTQNVEYVPSGIILEVTPKINPDGTVVMTVSPEVSQLAPANDADANIAIAPGVTARALQITRAVTTVSTQDGQTAVIGGLIRKSTEREERKVPWLGDVPVVGHLFRYDRLSKRRTELLIILTPHVVRSQAEAEHIKGVEASRMNWCLSAVEKIHGDLGLPTEVYVGTDADQMMSTGEMESSSIPLEDAPPVMPMQEEALPMPSESDAPEVDVPVPGEPPANLEPLLHRVNKTPASEGSAAAVELSLAKKRETEAARAKAREERAKRDEKLTQSAMDRRRDQFDAWKKRTLPWKREAKPATTTEDVP
jgi:type II secretion system protein D